MTMYLPIHTDDYRKHEDNHKEKCLLSAKWALSSEPPVATQWKKYKKNENNH